MTDKPKLAVDLDGVCADYHSYVLQMFPEFKGEYERGKFSAELNQKFWELATLDSFRELVPMQDAPQFLRDIAEFYDIIYITARNPVTFEVTVAWLKKYGFPEPENVVFTEDKGLYCLSNDIPILIEDQIRYALPAAGLGIKVILLDNPTNRPGAELFDNRVLSTPLIERANCWTDIMFKVYFRRS